MSWKHKERLIEVIVWTLWIALGLWGLVQCSG
jgi:hypothetical protein